ncbi:hypothetical protein ERJ70_00575 [Sediminibacillus dalangtanensis]|uniref:Uncharacterized protein n=1 Tax=Sediminibacillus dalangtanensis TaxID=2729421 RepID=A0ABX7VMB8_9BACI|nr:hypothetical protein [Sediminibacillus dalangtanensis]QTM97949.1 hypothetical protein ERJ70_00575 [Sediminibacillus dalangtanensis]
MKQNEQEEKNLYFYLGLGYTGLLLTGLGAVRFIAVYLDPIGQSFSLFGFLMLSAYIRYTERKLEVGKKARLLSKTAFILIFLLLAVWLNF